MGDTALFGFGVFVVFIFMVVVLFTIKEFQNLDEKKQKNYKRDRKDMNVKRNTD